MHRVRSVLAFLAAVVFLGGAVAFRAGGGPVPDAAPRTTARYWKGNLHTHSLWSDGDDFPEMIADAYRRRGYDFLALSDHNVLAEGPRWAEVPDAGPRAEAVRKYLARFGPDWVERRTQEGRAQVRLKPLAEFRSLLEEPGRFLLVPAEEITHQFARAPVHINAINIRNVIRPLDGADVAETIRVNHRLVAEQARKTGWRTIASLNHPNFGWGVRAEDMIRAEELRFFEVYNGHPSVRNYGDATHPGCERLWDIVLAVRLGKLRLGPVYGLATDDAHNYHTQAGSQANPGRGWVMVRAPFLTAEAVVGGLEAGDFYASTGVTLKDVRRDGDRLTLAIDPCPGVSYHTQFIATLRSAPLAGQPRPGPQGEPLDVTGIYSEEIGRVVGESDAVEPVYRLTGEELYVRARVTSSRPQANPFGKGDMEMAWTQPVVPRTPESR